MRRRAVAPLSPLGSPEEPALPRSGGSRAALLLAAANISSIRHGEARLPQVPVSGETVTVRVPPECGVVLLLEAPIRQIGVEVELLKSRQHAEKLDPRLYRKIVLKYSKSKVS